MEKRQRTSGNSSLRQFRFSALTGSRRRLRPRPDSPEQTAWALSFPGPPDDESAVTTQLARCRQVCAVCQDECVRANLTLVREFFSTYRPGDLEGDYGKPERRLLPDLARRRANRAAPWLQLMRDTRVGVSGGETAERRPRTTQDCRRRWPSSIGISPDPSLACTPEIVSGIPERQSWTPQGTGQERWLRRAGPRWPMS
jgi:hypothetical protein